VHDTDRERPCGMGLSRVEHVLGQLEAHLPQDLALVVHQQGGDAVAPHQCGDALQQLPAGQGSPGTGSAMRTACRAI
jgi:hypothetical protein